MGSFFFDLSITIEELGSYFGKDSLKVELCTRPKKLETIKVNAEKNSRAPSIDSFYLTNNMH